MQPEEWQTIPTRLPLERVVNVAQAGFDVVLADLGSHFALSDLSPMLKSARMILMVVEAEMCRRCGPCRSACWH